MSGYNNVTVNITVALESPPQWGWLIKVIVSHFIVAVGLVANSLTFVVMKSPRLRYKSYSHYLSALAIFDSLVLISQEMHMVDEILGKHNSKGFFYVFSDDACKLQLMFLARLRSVVCHFFLTDHLLYQYVIIQRDKVCYQIAHCCVSNAWYPAYEPRSQACGHGYWIVNLLLAYIRHFHQVFMFADAVCNLMSSWLIVAMAIERLCVVYTPLRRNMWCQQRGAVIIIFTLFCVLSCTQIFRFIMVENDGENCVASPVHNELYLLLHIYIYQFALLFITPVLLTLICNIGVLIRILRVENATHNEDSYSTRVAGNTRRRSRTTRMLVAISFTYVVTTLPQVMLTIIVYAMITSYGNGMTRTFLYIVPWIDLFQAVTNINYASNFFIYILSGRKFRVELRRIFKHHRGNSLTAGSSRTREEILMITY